jgi:hypothetical protein
MLLYYNNDDINYEIISKEINYNEKKNRTINNEIISQVF